jgi:hypothetical protein
VLRGQPSTEKASYCWSDALDLLSYGCASGPKACRAARVFRISQTTYLRMDSTRGNPDFHLCLMADGTPKFVEFRASGKWVPTSVCSFPSDGSFASMGYWRSTSVQVR